MGYRKTRLRVLRHWWSVRSAQVTAPRESSPLEKPGKSRVFPLCGKHSPSYYFALFRDSFTPSIALRSHRCHLEIVTDRPVLTARYKAKRSCRSPKSASKTVSRTPVVCSTPSQNRSNKRNERRFAKLRQKNDNNRRTRSSGRRNTTPLRIYTPKTARPDWPPAS